MEQRSSLSSSQPEMSKSFSDDVIIVFVLGGPGSGKGTQCSKIAKHFGFSHLSAGDLLRKEKESNIEIATLIENKMKEGNLVPSDIMVKLLQKAMLESDNDKFLIDGFPRNDDNLTAFDSVIGIEPKFVLYLACSEEVMIQRLMKRNQGRVDDNIETAKKRIDFFRRSTLPMIEYYRSKGQVLEINAEGSVEEVFEEIKKNVLNSY